MSNVIGVRQPAQLVRNFDAQALNPQPLPPKEVGFRLFGNLESRALNPQPLPPKELGFQLFGNLNSRALNPQPLPPKELSKLFGSLFNPADAVALNPQPLPPQGEAAFSDPFSTSVDSVVTGLAKKAGLGPILHKIKALVKPLLDKVLQKAIGNLPESVPPAA
jgi:hypothetical protein